MSSELHVIWIHTIGSSGPGCGHTLVLNVPNLFLPQGLGIICSFFTKHHPQHTHTLILAGKIHSLCYWQYLPKTSDLSMPSPRLRFLILNHLWSWVGTAHYSEEGMEGRPALVLGLTTWGSCLLLRHLSRAEISGQKWGWLQLPLKVHPIATHFLWLSLLKVPQPLNNTISWGRVFKHVSSRRTLHPQAITLAHQYVLL